MKVCLLDPALEDNLGTLSSNLGDLIIQEAVRREIDSIFVGAEVVSVSTHSPMQAEHVELIRSCDLTIVGGTNLLSSAMNDYKQWNVTLTQALRMKSVVLLGVGWWQYQDAPNLFTRLLLNLSLSRRFMHSVRDGYTLHKMRKVGYRSVINTGCPTMWPLASISPEEFARNKQTSVLAMLTDYAKNEVHDRVLLDILFSNYETVYFWPQGRADGEYVKSLDYPVVLLEHSLKGLQEFLASGVRFDYVGTRLHGGIRCLLDRRRSLILAIDNRAKEIANDTNLDVLNREDALGIVRWINEPRETRININSDRIEKWKGQFKRY